MFDVFGKRKDEHSFPALGINYTVIVMSETNRFTLPTVYSSQTDT